MTRQQSHPRLDPLEERNLSTADRRSLLDSYERLITVRQEVLRLLIDQIDGSDVRESLDAAISEVHRTVRKLNRYHPDAELLPLEWSQIGELGILVKCAQDKTKDMSIEEISEWRNKVVKEMSNHTAKIVSELEQQKETLSAEPSAAFPATIPTESITPRWDEAARELRYRTRLLKVYRKNPAKNQIDLIEAFHRAGWSRSIPDPFKDTRKLNQTLRDLNRALSDKAIRFVGDGTGEGVKWE
jgi:hypothetical protein